MRLTVDVERTDKDHPRHVTERWVSFEWKPQEKAEAEFILKFFKRYGDFPFSDVGISPDVNDGHIWYAYGGRGLEASDVKRIKQLYREAKTAWKTDTQNGEILYDIFERAVNSELSTNGYTKWGKVALIAAHSCQGAIDRYRESRKEVDAMINLEGYIKEYNGVADNKFGNPYTFDWSGLQLDITAKKHEIK